VELAVPLNFLLSSETEVDVIFGVILHIEPHIAVAALITLRDDADCIDVTIFIDEGDDVLRNATRPVLRVP